MPPRAPDLETHWLINFSDMFPTGQNLGPTKELRVIDVKYYFFCFLTDLQKPTFKSTRTHVTSSCDLMFLIWYQLGTNLVPDLNLQSTQNRSKTSYQTPTPHFPTRSPHKRCPLKGTPRKKLHPLKRTTRDEASPTKGDKVRTLSPTKGPLKAH